MAGLCECGNEPSISMKCGTVLDRLRNSYLTNNDSDRRSLFVLFLLICLRVVFDVTSSSVSLSIAVKRKHKENLFTAVI